jgi:flavorubredoxin
MKDVLITKDIKYIGVDDKKLDLFEGQYVIPNGISYNSYLILDEKIAIMDTVDAAASKEWLDNLKEALDGKKPDYLVISHLEPDHSGTIAMVIEEYPDITLVGNAKTFAMAPNFFDGSAQEKITVKEGDTLELGSHILQFIMAPMVHWPEVMVTYDQKDKVLFTADGFGKFGALDTDEDWACEARRYYFNIVGKYGAPVQMLLKKAAALDVQIICPLHGPALNENLEYYIDKYNTWSSYKPEDKGVLVAYASIHGNTQIAANKLADMLKEAGEEKVAVADLSRDDMAEVIEDAFRYDRIVLAAASYDGGVFPPMEELLLKLKNKAYQNRKAAIIENGSWAPSAARKMKDYLESMKDVEVIEPVVTITTTVKPETEEQLRKLAEAVKNA